jgi:hypothetical protein
MIPNVHPLSLKIIYRKIWHDLGAGIDLEDPLPGCVWHPGKLSTLQPKDASAG